MSSGGSRDGLFAVLSSVQERKIRVDRAESRARMRYIAKMLAFKILVPDRISPCRLGCLCSM
eukprot:6212887-Pleurochrysis_carterae.AAC.1